MRAIVESLYELQQLLLSPSPSSPEREAQMSALRSQIPVPVLAHFDRLIKHRRNGVALVRRGVCGECHLRICSGTVASLMHPTDLYLCDSCGRYLLMPADEIAARIEAAQIVAGGNRKVGRPAGADAAPAAVPGP